jgi:hypothetical protein
MEPSEAVETDLERFVEAPIASDGLPVGEGDLRVTEGRSVSIFTILRVLKVMCCPYDSSCE